MSHDLLEVTEPLRHVTCVTLRREERKNALSVALRDALEEAFARVAADDDAHAMVLAGGDGVFCAGYDLKEGKETGGKSFLHRFREFYEACYLFPKPVVAAVDGPALAGGFDLALMADFIVASTRAEFGHPEIDFAPAAVGPLARFVGPAKLRELCMLGERLDAETAERYGIVYQVVEPAQTLATATALAERLASKPPASLAGVKSVLARGTPDLITADGEAARTAAIGTGSIYDSYVSKKLG